MGAMGFPESMPMTQANWDRLLRENNLAHEQADFDSGWITTPTDKVVRHNLGVVSSEVWVYSSANNQGDPHSLDSWSNNGRETITVNGAQAFCRVRINKGSI